MLYLLLSNKTVSDSRLKAFSQNCVRSFMLNIFAVINLPTHCPRTTDQSVCKSLKKSYNFWIKHRAHRAHTHTQFEPSCRTLIISFFVFLLNLLLIYWLLKGKKEWKKLGWNGIEQEMCFLFSVNVELNDSYKKKLVEESHKKKMINELFCVIFISFHQNVWCVGWNIIESRIW